MAGGKGEKRQREGKKKDEKELYEREWNDKEDIKQMRDDNEKRKRKRE